jgi:hypothetical protein
MGFFCSLHSKDQLPSCLILCLFMHPLAFPCPLKYFNCVMSCVLQGWNKTWVASSMVLKLGIYVLRELGRLLFVGTINLLNLLLLVLRKLRSSFFSDELLSPCLNSSSVVLFLLLESWRKLLNWGGGECFFSKLYPFILAFFYVFMILKQPCSKGLYLEHI